jgi:hypothetical protein
MLVLLGAILAFVIVFARRPLWSGGVVSKTLYVATAMFAVVVILLLIIERIEAMGEYQ